jgi:hypothetical protein
VRVVACLPRGNNNTREDSVYNFGTILRQSPPNVIYFHKNWIVGVYAVVVKLGSLFT